MGAVVEERPDVSHRWAFRGPPAWAEIEPHGDHRMAMAFAVAALGAEGDTVIAMPNAPGFPSPNFSPRLNALSSDKSDLPWLPILSC